MKKYFVQTYNHLPPIKWFGDDLNEFFKILKKMLKAAPSFLKITRKIIDESVNVTSIDPEIFTAWESTFHSRPKWDWAAHLRSKLEPEECSPQPKKIT